MSKFWAWLANSPYASILKIAASGALVAVLASISNPDGSPLDPNNLWIVLGCALIPYILHLINPVSREEYALYRTAVAARREVDAEVEDASSDA